MSAGPRALAATRAILAVLVLLAAGGFLYSGFVKHVLDRGDQIVDVSAKSKEARQPLQLGVSGLLCFAASGLVSFGSSPGCLSLSRPGLSRTDLPYQPCPCLPDVSGLRLAASVQCDSPGGACGQCGRQTWPGPSETVAQCWPTGQPLPAGQRISHELIFGPRGPAMP